MGARNLRSISHLNTCTFLPGWHPACRARAHSVGGAVTGRWDINVSPPRRIAVDAVRKERRGFASMSPEKQREIASKGGRAAHEKGTAHEWTPDEARNAGRKGGQISRGGRGKLVAA